MDIDLKKLPTLWYEDKEGNRHLLSRKELENAASPPEGFIYQCSTFPYELHGKVIRIVQPDEVAACEHLTEHIRQTYGWIEGVEGRECASCNGTQHRKTGEEWPEKWNASGGRTVCETGQTWSEDLVLAMAAPSWWQRLWRQRYTLSQAILIAANSCSRCSNVLAHRYGLKDGYAEYSVEWQKSNTLCQFCEKEESHV